MKKILLLSAAVVLLASCGSGNGEGDADRDTLAKKEAPAVNTREVIVSKIRYFDSLATLPGQVTPNKTVAQSLISAYNEYVAAYPADTASARYAHLAAKVAVTVYSDEQAIVLIDRCLKEYPKHPERVQLLFWKAMVYDDRMNDKDRARQVYEQIIKEYPGTPAEQQAKDALKWTQKTDLEMIREFEKKNNVK